VEEEAQSLQRDLPKSLAKEGQGQGLGQGQGQEVMATEREGHERLA